MSSPVRVRFAPSPTGLLHIGGLRTALYNWLFARQHGGTVVLRIEDTDQARYVDEAEADIIDSLEWAGLDYDEGPNVGGPHEPYRQSERTEIYRRYADQLVANGFAYYAFDTPEEIDAMRERLQKAGEAAPAYDAHTRLQMVNSLTLPESEVRSRLEAGDHHVIRLKVPEHETVRFEDMVRGWVAFETSTLDDQVLLKSDGLPTYHLANVVDDHLMEITHVVRGEEWLPSVPKHLLLYDYLGWEPPKMAHLPLIMSPTGGKLSKRNAEKVGIPVSVREYREAGYEPAALLNFLAFLGWNPGDEREIFSLKELVEAYSIERTGQSGVQFNLDKLRWYNAHYVRAMSREDLADRVRPALSAAGYAVDDRTLLNVVDLLHERIEFVADFVPESQFFFEDPKEYEAAGVKKRWKADSADLLERFASRIQRLDPFGADALETELRSLADEEAVGAGRIIHPTRLAVSGRTAGPSLFEMLEVIGQEAVVRRMRKAIQVLG